MYLNSYLLVNAKNNFNMVAAHNFYCCMKLKSYMTYLYSLSFLQSSFIQNKEQRLYTGL